MKTIIILIAFLTFSCKSAKQIRCEELSNKKPLNIESYEELISYEKGEDREISMFILDGKLASKEILDQLIFSNLDIQIIEVKSIFGADGATLDGPRKRVLFIQSNLCNSWKIKKGKPVVK